MRLVFVQVRSVRPLRQDKLAPPLRNVITIINVHNLFHIEARSALSQFALLHLVAYVALLIFYAKLADARQDYA